MTNINRKVADCLSRDIGIQKDMKRGLINTRALARYLIDKYSIQASMDAVISAIRRHDLADVSDKTTEEIKNYLQDLMVFTKSNMVCIALKDEGFKAIAEDFLGKNLLMKNFRLVKAKNHIHLFVDKTDLDKKLELFPKDRIIKIEQDLAEIRLLVKEPEKEVKGVLARISNELSLNDIVLYDLVVAVPEFIFYLKEKDLLKAHECIMKIKEEEK